MFAKLLPLGTLAVATIVGFACAGGIVVPAHATDDSVVLIDGYIPRFAQKKEMNRLYGSAYGELHATILARQAKGQNLECSAQILSEVGWLIQYTNDKTRVDRRFADLRRSLDLPAEQQRAAREQSPVDGSWGGCFEEWFLRLHASADPLKELAYGKQRPAHPLRFLDKVDSPEDSRAYGLDQAVACEDRRQGQPQGAQPHRDGARTTAVPR
jgi:hypothetical protein